MMYGGNPSTAGLGNEIPGQSSGRAMLFGGLTGAVAEPQNHDDEIGGQAPKVCLNNAAGNRPAERPQPLRAEGA